MASLHKEATTVYTGLQEAVGASRLPAFLSFDINHPDWVHRAMAALTTALCNFSLPLGSTVMRTPLDRLEVCSKESQKGGCTPDRLVQRLWKITTYADHMMKESE